MYTVVLVQRVPKILPTLCSVGSAEHVRSCGNDWRSLPRPPWMGPAWRGRGTPARTFGRI